MKNQTSHCETTDTLTKNHLGIVLKKTCWYNVGGEVWVLVGVEVGLNQFCLHFIFLEKNIKKYIYFKVWSVVVVG